MDSLLNELYGIWWETNKTEAICRIDKIVDEHDCMEGEIVKLSKQVDELQAELTAVTSTFDATVEENKRLKEGKDSLSLQGDRLYQQYMNLEAKAEVLDKIVEPIKVWDKTGSIDSLGSIYAHASVLQVIRAVYDYLNTQKPEYGKFSVPSDFGIQGTSSLKPTVEQTVEERVKGILSDYRDLSSDDDRYTILSRESYNFIERIISEFKLRG